MTILRPAWHRVSVPFGAALLALSMTLGCDQPPVQAQPDRIVVGAEGTLVVNNRRATQIPVRVLDAGGRELPTDGVRFERTGGDTIPIGESGTVTCAKRGEAGLRVSLGGVATRVMLRCRPVASVGIAGPMQFILGDSARDIPVQVLGVDGAPVDSFGVTVTILTPGIGSVSGLRMQPVSVGTSVVDVRVGDVTGSVGLHVYERAESLAGLDAVRGMVALPLRLSSGEIRRWPLPPGQWMLTMLPSDAEPLALRMRVDGANCAPSGLTPRRIVCQTMGDTWVIVHHPSTRPAAELDGTLLVRRVNS